MIQKPQLTDIPNYFVGYISLVPENDLIQALSKNLEFSLAFFSSIPKEKESFAYAEGKWTIKQVLSHIIDTERVFAYRSLRFSRFDNTELAGYDENLYSSNSNTENRTLNDLLEEFSNVRKSTLNLFENMSDEMLDFKGLANKNLCSARALGFMIVGHTLHHCKVLEERYL